MVKTDILDRAEGEPTTVTITGKDYRGLKIDLVNLRRASDDWGKWNSSLMPVNQTLERAGVQDAVRVQKKEGAFLLAPKDKFELTSRGIRCKTSSRRHVAIGGRHFRTGFTHLATGPRQVTTGVRLEIRPRQ